MRCTQQERDRSRSYKTGALLVALAGIGVGQVIVELSLGAGAAFELVRDDLRLLGGGIRLLGRHLDVVVVVEVRVTAVERPSQEEGRRGIIPRTLPLWAASNKGKRTGIA